LDQHHKTMDKIDFNYIYKLKKTRIQEI